MNLLRPTTWIAAAIAALIVVLPFQPLLRREAGGFAVEVRAASTRSGHLQMFFDSGQGFNETDSTLVPLAAGEAPSNYRLALPQGEYRNLRLDPIDRDGTVILGSVRIVDGSGRTVRSLPLELFHPNGEIQSLRPVPAGAEVVVVPGKTDPQLYAALDPQLVLRVPLRDIILAWLRSAAAVLAVFLLVGAVLERVPAVRSRLGRLTAWMRLRPRRSVALAAALGVVVSCHPVIFAGRSFVSPNYGSWLLYDDFPTLPGYAASRVEDVRGSDIGALMWQQVPYSAIQHRSLLWNFELPLWNRDNAGGTPLLGQGQSMFGDPFHLLVIAADGAAWAWDVKFLIARWLLAAGLGLCVWTVARHRGAAMLVAAAAPFCGFFLYRINHPAVFSFCYSPWIVYFWLRAARSVSRRETVFATAGLLLANWTELASGTVKEAGALLLALNLTGAAILTLAERPARWRVRQFAWLAAAGVLFAGLSSPLWYTFWDALRSGLISSPQPAAWQIQPSLLVGLFDEALYRPINRDAYLFNPSANFFLLAGVLYFFATLRDHLHDRRILGLLAGALLPFALVYGLVPPAWIERCPFLAGIHHIDDCFSSALIVLAAILAGLGFAAAARRLPTAAGPADLGCAGLLLAVLLWAYFGFGHAAHRSLLGEFTPALTVWKDGAQLDYGAFVPGYLASLVLALILGGVLARRWLTQTVRSPALAIALGVCALALVWRGATYAGGASWPRYMAQSPPRANLRARSSAEKEVEKSARSVPLRSIGTDSNFFPGWTAFYGLETISGPDAVASPYYRQLVQSSPLPLIWDWRLMLSRANLAAARPFLDFLNVRHYLDLRSDPAELAPVLQLDRRADLDVYESRTVWPRAFFVDRVREYASVPALIGLIAADRDQPFAAVQAGELDPTSPVAALVGPPDATRFAAATGYRLTENSTSFALNAPTAGLVVLTETYWDGYPHVRVDGRPAEVVRTNHAFIGIPVTAGEHRITVRYRPRRFNVTLLIAAASALLLFGLFAAARRSPSTPA